MIKEINEQIRAARKVLGKIDILLDFEKRGRGVRGDRADLGEKIAELRLLKKLILRGRRCAPRDLNRNISFVLARLYIDGAVRHYN